MRILLILVISLLSWISYAADQFSMITQPLKQQPAASALSEEPQIRTIQLKQQPLETVLPIVKAMLPRNRAVSGQGKLLVLKITPEEFQQIQKLVTQLDKPLKSMVIFVRRTRADLLRESTNARTYQYSTDNAQINDSIQEVRVMEGQAAFISNGSAFLVPGYFDGWAGSNVGLRYEQMSSGFMVVPHVINQQQVQLQILDKQEQMNGIQNTQIDFNKTGTTLRVPLGEWVNLTKTASADEDNFKHKNTYQTENDRSERANIYVKVIPAR